MGVGMKNMEDIIVYYILLRIYHEYYFVQVYEYQVKYYLIIIYSIIVINIQFCNKFYNVYNHIVDKII